MTDLRNNGGELPADRQKTVEAGLAMFQQVSAERDKLREELRKANEEITKARVEIDSLQQLHNMLESHIQSYMMQRDDAIAQRAAFETLFATIMAQLRVFHLPAVPLVKEVRSNEPKPGAVTHITHTTPKPIKGG